MKKLIALLMTFALVFSMMVVPTMAVRRTINGVETDIYLYPINSYTAARATMRTISAPISHQLFIDLRVYGHRNDGHIESNFKSSSTWGTYLQAEALAPFNAYDSASAQYFVDWQGHGAYLNRDR